MDTNKRESICISQAQLLDLVCECIQKEVSELRPLLREPTFAKATARQGRL
jgi:hypothetical protein